MSTPLLWIIIPLVIAILLFLLRHWYRVTVVIGSITTILLTVSAWSLPINKLIRLGPITFKIDETFNILGRSLFLGESDRNLVIMIFGLAAFWFIASFEARAGRMFISVGLAMVTIWIAAMAVEPFLYAALLLELSMLLSILILLPPGSAPGRGVIRYLVLQTFGMPFILLTGWLLSGVESSPSDLTLVVHASTLLVLGFLFLLAIFPFHTWLPMLAEESPPYAAAFVFFFQPLMIILFGLSFLDKYAWLRQSSSTYDLLIAGGILMVLIGGTQAALQQHLARVLGFAVLANIGTLLLTIGVRPSLELFFSLQIPRALALALWSLALAVMMKKQRAKKQKSLELNASDLPPEETTGSKYLLGFTSSYSLGREMPVTTTAMIVAILSLAGYPLFALFPIYQSLLIELSAHGIIYATLLVLGNLCLGLGGLRCVTVLVMGDKNKKWQVGENWLEAVFMTTGVLLTILLGLFPQWLMPYLVNISQAFTQLSTSINLP